jgi:P2 family phage major capsid protein
MRNPTRLLYTALLAQIAQLNGVSDATLQFSADPSVQQTLETKIQESSDFLKSVNFYGVDELKGEKVGIVMTSTIAGRTDTSGAGVRLPRNVADTESHDYECKKTDFDTGIPYALLDAWAKFPDFQVRVRDAIIQRQALDRLMIGFNGTSAANNTDRVANPLLQDVNIGWLQQYRTHAAARVMTGGATAGTVKVGGAGADYNNLDALVYDVVNSLLDPWHQKNPGLVVVLGRDLMHDKYFPLINNNQVPTEKLATDMIVSQKRIGGLQAVQVPYIPDDTLMVTDLKNLSLYYQTSGRRRFIKEEPEKNRIANYESSNDAYVVEDYGLGCVVENIAVAP